MWLEEYYLTPLTSLKAGFKIVRQGQHIVMSDGNHILTIPRNNPVNAYTMAVLCVMLDFL